MCFEEGFVPVARPSAIEFTIEKGGTRKELTLGHASTLLQRAVFSTLVMTGYALRISRSVPVLRSVSSYFET